MKWDIKEYQGIAGRLWEQSIADRWIPFIKDQ